jgi:hypothetical protein
MQVKSLVMLLAGLALAAREWEPDRCAPVSSPGQEPRPSGEAGRKRRLSSAICRRSRSTTPGSRRAARWVGSAMTCAIRPTPRPE